MDRTSDQDAAHQLLTEIRTRISTQPLPYQHGVEEAALRSLFQLFEHTREAIKDHPGCQAFASRATEVLNLSVRPLTAKWHRALGEGRLASRDGAAEFRGELARLQLTLRKFAEELHQMAYGVAASDPLAPDVMAREEVQALFEPLDFGIPTCTAEPRMASDEADAVATRRRRHGITTPSTVDAIGLALSGGGIRSATFSLGVVQVLAERGLLKEVDFLSTVSGGGYTGCFLTQRLGNGEDLSAVAGADGPDPEPVRYMRHHAKYLLVNGLKEQWAMVSATFAGMLLNWSAPVLAILLLALLASLTGRWIHVDFLQALQVAAVSCLVALGIYGCGVRMGPRASRLTGGVLAGLLAATSLLAVGIAVDRGLDAASSDLKSAGRLGALLAAALAGLPGVVRFVPVLKTPAVRKIVLKVVLVLAGIVVPFACIVLFHVFLALASTHLAGLCIAALLLAVCTVIVDINLTGPHRLYRDGLAKTFIQKTEEDVAPTPLENINPLGSAPYQLINAALNIPSSTNTSFKDRGCDFFLFSRNWTGSPVSGYWPTKEWKANGAPLDLATAMAVSGAAFSSYMGLGSKPSLAALLTLLNVRLGFWVRKPGQKKAGKPGFVCLLREMFSIGMSEKNQWLNLSDGGHIENLAAYELIRRRCKFIVCVDGESDPGFTFEGLMTLVRHVQIDFGVRIDAKLDDIRPDAGSGYSRNHFHLCRIHYSDGIGLLLYVKLSVTGNESELIRRYRITNPDFPHQTTLDQFFDQEQFEAYRQLGAHSIDGLFHAALMGEGKPRDVPDWFRQLAKNLLEPTAG